MKSYYNFILENVSGSTNLTQPSTSNQISDIQIDTTKYNSVKISLHNFWKNIITDRNLNFSKDDDNTLNAKRKNIKYKKYWEEIDKIINKREIDKNINLQSKIKDAISALTNLKFPIRNAKEVVNIIVKEQPDITIEQLIKQSIQKLGKK